MTNADLIKRVARSFGISESEAVDLLRREQAVLSGLKAATESRDSAREFYRQIGMHP